MVNEVMTVEQLAKYLQLDEQTVYRKAHVGTIPAVRIGRILRFKRDVIDGWLRLSSFKWTYGKREELRSWGESFAKTKGIREEDVQEAIRRKRYSK